MKVYIGIWMAILLFLLALFALIYLLLHLLKVPPRQLPDEVMQYQQYLYEPSSSGFKNLWPDAPAGTKVVDAPMLASTNLIDWFVVHCRIDTKGELHAPDGAIIGLDGEWSEEKQEWVSFTPRVVRPGTNELMIFRLP